VGSESQGWYYTGIFHITQRFVSGRGKGSNKWSEKSAHRSDRVPGTELS